MFHPDQIPHSQTTPGRPAAQKAAPFLRRAHRRTGSMLNRPALLIVAVGVLAATHLTGGTASAPPTHHAPAAMSAPVDVKMIDIGPL